MKKMILMGFGVLLVVLCIASANPKQGQTTAADTATAWAEHVSVPTADWEDMFFIINNLGATNAMAYKVYGYPVYGGTAYETIVDSTQIAASGQALIKISNTAYAEIAIQVIKVTTATSCQVEYILKP